jgi:16S rRNA (guanine(966)-N(2))-methyltransferase RsmD
VFHVLGDDVRGSRFLDLYAGTGIMGIEALSRGAVECVFVERSRGCGRILKENLEVTGLEDRSMVVLDDVRKWLAPGHVRSGVIFADPPYGTVEAAGILRMLARDAGSEVLWVVIQHGSREELDDRDGLLYRVRSRRYGETSVDFYQTGLGGQT